MGKHSRMQTTLVFFLGLIAAASAITLTDSTFDEETAGKTVFIKFQAPW